MREIIEFLLLPSAAVIISNLIGFLIIYCGLNSNKDIASQAGTSWDSNKAVLSALVYNRYDQTIGLFTVIAPATLQSAGFVLLSYLFLLMGILLRFSCLRRIAVEKRIKSIEILIKKEETESVA